MRKKILVLDDDNDILEILTILLDNDYEIKTLSRGDTIFEDIKEFEPDLILLDVLLADMDGRIICKDIKDNHLTSFIPVILISGTHDLTKLLHLPGAPDGFVAKPFDIDYLLQIVEKQLAA